MVNDANLPVINDEELLTMNQPAFIDLMANVLRDYRDQNDLAFSKEGKQFIPAKLAHSSLVYDCFMAGEAPRPQLQALGVQALVHWAVDQLGPSHNANQSEDGRRQHASIYYSYLERKTFKEVADDFFVDEQTVYDWRLKALAKLANILRRELEQPQHHPQRKHYALTERYRVYQPDPLDGADEQRLLRFCALLRQPLPVQRLRKLAEQIGIAQPQACIERLVFDGWLVQEGEQLATGLRDPEVRAYLRNRLASAECQSWYNELAALAAEQGSYLEAALNWCTAEDYATAATTLIAHYRDIVDAGQIRQLYEVQSQFTAATLDRNTLAQVKIAVGRAALLVENIDTAVKFLQDALSAPDDLLKAEAHYYLAKAWENARFEEARHYFNRGIQLLEELPLEKRARESEERRTSLLADLYVGQAWLYILLSPDVTVAEEALRKAQILIAKSDNVRWVGLHRTWVNLHNALAGLYALQQETQRELDHYFQAVIAAREVGDNELLWKTLHNLAQTYIHTKQYQPGLDYLAQAHDIAVMLGNQEWVGKCAQTHGAACYYQGQVAEAINHYQVAAAAFVQTGNDHWLAAAYADLTEAYLALPEPDLPSARIYYTKAIAQAERASAEDVGLQLLKKLAQDYPELKMAALNARQVKALEAVRQRGSITTGELMSLTGIAKSTAERTLDELMELGLLIRVGKGRSTKYIAPGATT